MTPDEENQTRPSGRLQHGDHLQYLLTAYLFGDLSAAGKAEVEGHLKDCAQCREELAGLRVTLAAAEEALHGDRKEYVFDDRRRARVLVAARQARFGFLAKMGLSSLPRFNRRWANVAALLMVLLTGGFLLLISTVGDQYAPRMERLGRSNDYGATPQAPAAPAIDGYYNAYPKEAKDAAKDETIVTTNLEKEKPAEYDERRRDVFKDQVGSPEDLPPVEHPVVKLEDVIVADHEETAGEMDLVVQDGISGLSSDAVSMRTQEPGRPGDAYGQRKEGGMAGGRAKETKPAEPGVVFRLTPDSEAASQERGRVVSGKDLAKELDTTSYDFRASPSGRSDAGKVSSIGIGGGGGGRAQAPRTPATPPPPPAKTALPANGPASATTTPAPTQPTKPMQDTAVGTAVAQVHDPQTGWASNDGTTMYFEYKAKKEVSRLERMKEKAAPEPAPGDKDGDMEILRGDRSNVIDELRAPKAPAAKEPVRKMRRSGGTCFPAGTLVQTVEGPRAIERIAAGTEVLSCNPETGQWALKAVIQPLHHQYIGDVVSIRVPGADLEATGNHPFWVCSGTDLRDRGCVADVPRAEQHMTERGRWVEARALRLGDRLALCDGSEATVQRLASHQASLPVFNLTVADWHTYAVSAQGILVHNKESVVSDEETERDADDAISDIPLGGVNYAKNVTGNKELVAKLAEQKKALDRDEKVALDEQREAIRDKDTRKVQAGLTFQFQDSSGIEPEHLKEALESQEERRSENQEAVAKSDDVTRININSADNLNLVLDKLQKTIGEPLHESGVTETGEQSYNGRRVLPQTGQANEQSAEPQTAEKKDFRTQPFRWTFAGSRQPGEGQGKTELNQALEGLKEPLKDFVADKPEETQSPYQDSGVVVDGREMAGVSRQNVPTQPSKDALNALVEQQKELRLTGYYADPEVRQGDLKPDGEYLDRAERAQAEKDAQIRRYQEGQAAAQSGEKRLLQEQQQAIAQNQQQAQTIESLADKNAGLQVATNQKIDALGQQIKEMQQKLDRSGQTESTTVVPEDEYGFLKQRKAGDLNSETRRQQKLRELALVEENIQHATELSEARLSTEREQEENRVRQQLDETNALFEIGEYERAEQLAGRVLETDPTNEQARSIQLAAGDRKHIKKQKWTEESAEETESRELRMAYAQALRDKRTIEQDLMEQTQRIEGAIERGAPREIFGLTEDTSAKIIQSSKQDSPVPDGGGMNDSSDVPLLRQRYAELLQEKEKVSNQLALQTQRITNVIQNGVPMEMFYGQDPEAYHAPLPAAKVMAVRPELDLVMLNVGEKNGAKPGYRMTISRGGQFVAKAEIQKVYPDMCTARVFLKKEEVQKEDTASSRVPGGAATGIGSLLQVEPERGEKMLRAVCFYQASNKRLDIDEFLRQPASIPCPAPTDEGLDEDAFIEKYGIRPFVDAASDHLSTFGLDVDTASYTRTRALLEQDQLPAPETVRTEEFVNYFKQDYMVPGDETFGVFVEGMPAPFAAPGMELLKIGIKSRDPRPDERKPANLTFVVDVSGSMARADNSGQERVELIRTALKGLVEALQPDDSVCLVTFSDQARLALPRTQARFAPRILDALNRLEPGGATNVEAGLEMGYRMADEAYSADQINRVIFCSDGVANVGAEGPAPMLKLVKTFAGRGIDMNTVGFGMGKYNDEVMQELADRGNGQYHFVNTPAEAQKVFREQLPPNLDVLARDAKAQVDFDPAVVKRYRLLGYEKRKIADADFRNDKIDAGEVQHNTLVTALYEIERHPGAHGSLGKIFLRWKDAALSHRPVIERNYPLSEGLIASTPEAADPNLRFLACVAEFAELLRNSRWAQDGSYAAVLKELNKLPPDFRVKPECEEVRKLVWKAHVLSMRQWLSSLKR